MKGFRPGTSLTVERREMAAAGCARPTHAGSDARTGSASPRAGCWRPLLLPRLLRAASPFLRIARYSQRLSAFVALLLRIALLPLRVLLLLRFWGLVLRLGSAFPCQARCP